ncbi:FxLYD domain-containing protein [Gorillibacterium sp. sgz5001074]|uniref:FxLYD domain-containing protein n=1 Tax=Gorillibacterium sp. sgz5001074 TaxID=3446695 RepID=UPI003F66EAC6
MKMRVTVAGIGLFLGATLTGALGAHASELVRLMVNGKPSPVEIRLIDDVSYAPVRAVAEMLQAEVQWDGDTQTVHVLTPGYGKETDGVYTLDSVVVSGVQAVKDDYGWNLTADVRNPGKEALRTAGLTAVFYNKSGERIGTATGTVYSLNPGQTKTVIFATTSDLAGYDRIRFQTDFTS